MFTHIYTCRCHVIVLRIIEVCMYIQCVYVSASSHICNRRWALYQHCANTTRRCTFRSASGCALAMLNIARGSGDQP